MMDTTTTLRQQIDALRDAITELARREHCVGHNEGTYGAAECQRKTGSGQPRAGLVEVYETVGGRRRRTGPDNAPGVVRYCTPLALTEDRRRLKEMQDHLYALCGTRW